MNYSDYIRGIIVNNLYMHNIKWGIVGCGNVTEVKSGPAFGKVDGSRVVAVMRRDGEKAADYAKRHHIPRWYDDANDLILDPDVNAVYIATPPSSHATYAIQAMEAGKVAYVEKPMAAGYKECLAMNEVSARTGMPLYVAYYRRYLPYFQKVKEILEQHVLGRILFVQVTLHVPARTEDRDPHNLPWRVDPGIAGAGYFYDLASHQIDLFDWFFGKAIKVEGKYFNRAGYYAAEDLVFADIEYETGIPLTGTWCFTAGKEMQQDRITVYGTEGSLEFSTFGFSPIRLIRDDQVTESLPSNPENIQYWFIRNMVEELQGKRPESVNGECAANTNKIMDIILGKL
jgi:1,5-anhydro-D-fructose reductase (1,5-anhydro-D-mannitol-forming)